MADEYSQEYYDLINEANLSGKPEISYKAKDMLADGESESKVLDYIKSQLDPNSNSDAVAQREAQDALFATTAYPVDVRMPTAEENLSSMNKADLQKAAQARGLDSDGTKDELLERIQNHDAANGETYTEPQQ